MKRNYNVIRIDGFKGICFAVFAVGCLIAGFLSFPGWVCMHIWNFIAGYFSQMPVMSMVHGIMLWCILALSAYALNKGNFSVSFGASAPMPGSEERIKEILRKMHEEHANLVKTAKENIAKEIEEIEKESDDETVLK